MMETTGLNIGSRLTLVTETHVITCIVKSLRLRDRPDNQQQAQQAPQPLSPTHQQAQAHTAVPTTPLEPRVGLTLQEKLATQATERFNANEFEVALETGIAVKRNG